MFERGVQNSPEFISKKAPEISINSGKDTEQSRMMEGLCEIVHCSLINTNRCIEDLIAV